MKFDDLDKQMRVFETGADRCVPAEAYMVARIDGRNFTRLTKEGCSFEAPFDVRFRDHMLHTVMHLMDCGFKMIFGYTQSDEISLLFHSADQTFGRKTRKLTSVLAGEASAAFSLSLQKHAVFDCRICELPTKSRVVDYFRWRQEDARRNALNAHCYWALRKSGKDVGSATQQIVGISTQAKHQLLSGHNISFASLPLWQKHGAGITWEKYEKSAIQPLTNEPQLATRRRLTAHLELPSNETYAALIERILAADAGV